MTPEILWSFASVAIAATGSLVAGLFSLASRPKRRLSVILTTTPLLDEPSGIKVQYRGVVIRQPTVVEMKVSNVGRHNVAASDFNENRPIRVSLTAPVVSLMDVPAKHSTKIAVSPGRN